VYGRRRCRVLPGGVLALLFAYTAFTAASHSLNNGRGSVSAVGWPQQGQAALVLGNGRPAASPDEQLVRSPASRRR